LRVISFFFWLLPCCSYATLVNLGVNANNQNSSNVLYPPTYGYNYVADAVTFYITNNNNIGETTGISIETNSINAPSDVLIFTGNSTVAGSVAATYPISEIALTGIGSTVTFNDQVNVQQFNFSASDTTAIFPDGIQITGTIENTTDIPATGTLQLQGGGLIAGSVGSTSSLKEVILNALGQSSKVVTFQGEIINAPIYIMDNGQPTTVILNNANLTALESITVQTNAVDILNIENASSVSSLGTPTHAFALVMLAGNENIFVNGDIFATEVQFQGNQNFILGGEIISGTITTTNANQGTLTLNNSFSANNPIGSSGLHLNAIKIHNSVNFNEYDIYANQVKINNGSTIYINGHQTIHGSLILADKALLYLDNDAVLQVDALNLNAGAILQLDMNNLPNSPGSIIVNDSATLNSAITVNVMNAPMQVPIGTTSMPLISCQNNCQLNEISVNGSNLTTGFQTHIDSNILNLIITYYPTILPASSKNLNGVASTLETIINTGVLTTGELNEIVKQLQWLTGSSLLNNALASLAPIVDYSTLANSFNIQLENIQIITQRLNSSKGYSSGDDIFEDGLWVKLFGQHAHQSERQSIAGYKNNVIGVALGKDALVQENLILGAGLFWSNTNVQNHVSPGSTTTIQSYQATLYGQYNFTNPLFIDGYLSFAYNDYHSNRNIMFGNFNQTAHSNYHGLQPGAQALIGYDYVENGAHIIPLASLFYSYLGLNSYTETGAGTANQSVNGSAFDMLLGGLGLLFSYDWNLPSAILQPEVHVNYFYDFINSEMAATSQFTGGGPSFATSGIKPSPDSYNMGISVISFSKSNNLMFIISYDFDIQAQYTAHAGFMTVRFEW